MQRGFMATKWQFNNNNNNLIQKNYHLPQIG
jgi:hypothetical protein